MVTIHWPKAKTQLFSRISPLFPVLTARNNSFHHQKNLPAESRETSMESVKWPQKSFTNQFWETPHQVVVCTNAKTLSDHLRLWASKVLAQPHHLSKLRLLLGSKLSKSRVINHKLCQLLHRLQIRISNWQLFNSKKLIKSDISRSSWQLWEPLWWKIPLLQSQNLSFSKSKHLKSLE